METGLTRRVRSNRSPSSHGNLYRFEIQAFAAGVVILFVFAMTYGLLKLIGIFVPLQESQEKLKIGDAAIHGEVAYDDDKDEDTSPSLSPASGME